MRHSLLHSVPGKAWLPFGPLKDQIIQIRPFWKLFARNEMVGL